MAREVSVWQNGFSKSHYKAKDHLLYCLCYARVLSCVCQLHIKFNVFNISFCFFFAQLLYNTHCTDEPRKGKTAQISGCLQFWFALYVMRSCVCVCVLSNISILALCESFYDSVALSYGSCVAKATHMWT